MNNYNYILDILNIFLKISIISSISTFLNNGELNSLSFLFDIISTSIGFLYVSSFNKKFEKQIKYLDNKIGYNVISDISGPFIILGIKLLFNSNGITMNKILPTLYTTIGFTVYNVLVKEKILQLDNFSEDLKSITETMIKPLIMLSVSDSLQGDYPFDVDSLRKFSFTITGFVSHFLIVKYFKIN